MDPVAVARLKALESHSGRSEFLPGLIDSYSRSAARYLEGLGAALREDSAETVVTHAHGLKGSSSTLGLTRVADLCERLEALGRAGVLDGCAELVVELEHAAPVAIAAFRELIRPSTFPPESLDATAAESEGAGA